MRPALLAAAVLAACSPAKRARPGDDPSTAFVHEAGAQLRSGPIGASRPEEGSYVLVDVSNRSATDRLVTIGGSLLDGNDSPVSELGADELRVPAGGKRTFALVADHPAPAARRMRFKVLDAVAVDYPPQIAISGERFEVRDLAVATAVATNTLERDCTAVIAATFYSGDGKILTRPFTVVPLAPGAARPLRFEGPKEAASAVIFMGQVAFH